MTRIRPRRPTPRRRSAPRAGDGDPAEAIAWWEYVNHMLAVRSGGCCEVCGRSMMLLSAHVERHHRQRRREGGDRLSNLLLIHGGPNGCHQWITEHPAEAIKNGWIVPAGIDLETVPVRLALLGWRTLTDDGGTIAAQWE